MTLHESATQPLYQVHARSGLNFPDLNGRKSLHEASSPMTYAECLEKQAEWSAAVESPSWEFTIEECT